MYVEFNGENAIPDSADGLIVPPDYLDSVLFPANLAAFLKIDESLKGEIGKLFEKISSSSHNFEGLILPPVCDPEEIEYMCRLMEKHGLYRSRGLRVLATVKHPCSLLVASELMNASDGLYIDMTGLIRELYGENASLVMKERNVLALEKTVSMLQNAVEADGEKDIIYSLTPDFESDMAALLVSRGVRAVSCTSIRMESTVDAMAREEHRLLLRNVGSRGG